MQLANSNSVLATRIMNGILEWKMQNFDYLSLSLSKLLLFLSNASIISMEWFFHFQSLISTPCGWSDLTWDKHHLPHYTHVEIHPKGQWPSRDHKPAWRRHNPFISHLLPEGDIMAGWLFDSSLSPLKPIYRCHKRWELPKPKNLTNLHIFCPHRKDF